MLIDTTEYFMNKIIQKQRNCSAVDRKAMEILLGKLTRFRQRLRTEWQETCRQDDFEVKGGSLRGSNGGVLEGYAAGRELDW